MIKRIKRDKKENNADVIERVKKDSQEIAALVSGGRSIIRDVFVIDADKAAPEDCIAFKAVGDILSMYNIGVPPSGYGTRQISTRKDNGADVKVMKAAVKRAKGDREGVREGSSRFPTFIKKVIPEIAALGYIIGAAYLSGTARTDGARTDSYMVYWSHR